MTKYPNIEFINTDTQTILSEMIKDYESYTGRSIYPSDPIRLMLSWIADIIIHERVIINETGKQNVPRYAKGEYLDSIAEIFRDEKRLPATSAKVILRFFISNIFETEKVIPVGTRVSAGENIIFETVNDLVIPPKLNYGDVYAVCQTKGTVGNGFTEGQIKSIIDIFPYFEKVENITQSGGGSDEESDEAFYERMRDNMNSYSSAGSKGAYIYHVKSVSSLIKDVCVTSPSAGYVDIRILLETGLPDDEIIKKVYDTVNSDTVRPLTDYVTISAPNTVEFDIDFTYYMSNNSELSITETEKLINEAKESYIKWQTEKMGRDINPSYLISLLMQTGIKRVDVRKPVFKEVSEGNVAVLVNDNIVNGGKEDE